tara:strand:- start:72 stop:224 length:153 start_codon:yes stop_codon:yes gene_type:complete
MDELTIKLGKAINNMFNENWKNFDLGSKQADLIESYVLATIVDVLEKQNV